MNTSPNDVLKARLAAGEITIEEYRKVQAALSEPQGDIDEGQTSRCSETVHTGALIVEFEDLKVFQEAISYNNISHPISEVTSVRGGQSEKSFQFVPTEKSSSCYIEFTSGQSILISEKRILFAGKRHEQIANLLAIVRRVTFSHRVQNLVKKLVRDGQIPLTTAIIVGGKDAAAAVFLRKDGTVLTPNKSVNLKTAKAIGTFGLGTEWRSLNALSHSSNPYEVVLSEKRGMLGAMVPRDALKFIPFVDDVDIVHSLLAWLAEPANKLV
jgi:hypothetical protein